MGDALLFEELGRQAITPAGTFAVSIAPGAEPLAEARRNGGWLNVVVESVDAAGRAVSKGTAVHWTGSTWSKPNNPLRLLRIEDAKGRSLNPSIVQSAVVRSGKTETSTPCMFRFASRPRFSTRIGQFHNVTNARGNWQYGATADSDIEMGVKFRSGGQSIEGTRHIGNTLTAYVAGQTPNAYNRWIRTDFWYNRYTRQDVANSPVGTWCDNYGYVQVGDVYDQPSDWAYGITDDGGPGAEYRGCPVAAYATDFVPPSGGTSLFYLGSTRATKVGWAVDTGFLDLGSTSGYSTNLDMKWDSIHGTGVKLCGRYGHLTSGAPGIVDAQNR